MQPQSTDQTPISNNQSQFAANVIKRGSFTITLSTSDSTGVQGTTTTIIKNVGGTVLYPDVDVYRDTSSGTPSYRKCPYVVNDTNGAIQELVYYDIQYDASGSVIDLVATMYSRTLTLNTVRTFYYVVYSTKIAPEALDTATIRNFNYN